MQIVCIKAGATNRPNLGYLKPLWVINSENGDWENANEKNFPCPTQKIFVTSGYESIDTSFNDYTLFSISVTENQQIQSGDSDFYCNFIAHGEIRPGIPNGKRLEDKELIQIISVALPDPNKCSISDYKSPPFSNYIAIEDEKNIFGIFEQETTKDELGVYFSSLKLINTPLLNQEKYSRSLLKTNFVKIPEINILETIINNEKFIFIHNIIEIIRAGKYERQEYMTDEEIIKFGGEILEKTSPQAFKKQQIQLYQKNLAHSKFTTARPLLDKFFKVISKVDDNSTNNVEWMEKAFSSEDGCEILSRIFAKNCDLLKEYSKTEFDRQQSEINAKLEKHFDRQRELETKVKETEAYLGNLNRDLELVETKKKSISAGQLEVIKNGFDNEIDARRKNIEELDNNIEQKRAELINYHKVDNIIDLINQKTLIRNHIDQEIKDMNERKNKVSQELSAPEYELKKKLFDMKPYVEALTGFTPEHDENSNVYKTLTAKTSGDKKTLLDLRDSLIDNFEIYFKNKNRQYSKHAITNYLISTQQSFMTIVAGLPGVGKTSLVRLLAGGLGIQSRFLEISVGRGWSSSRDLVGYFNPLTAKFQGSQTGFYDCVQQTHSDITSEDSNLIVLLDEANLSPIEHYWSSFMGMSDNPARGQLRVGNDSYAISKNMRFIATINYDNTTEPLSQRMIDRCPIIILGETNSSLTSEIEDIPAAQNISVYASDIMEMWFGNPTIDMSLTSNDIRILEELIQICTNSNTAHGKQIILSPRKLDSITRYCKRAYPIMRTERDNLAIDYAVAQHLLPLIDGQGENYRNRLLSLQTAFEKYHLDLALKNITRIIEFGRQDLDSYNFFSW